MSAAAVPALVPVKPRSRHVLRLSLALAGLVVVVFFGVTCARIVHEANEDETRPADAIVVFGAAEYSGKPSPVFRARLDHAAALYNRGIAPVVIVTGGSGRDPHFSEGGVGLSYLLHRGVPNAHLIAETKSSNTDISAERVADIMRDHGMRTCVAVSDRYHMFRVKRMMRSQGLTVFGAPRPETHASGFFQRAETVSREAISYTLWRLHLT